ncbi:hypothetical protein Pmar_PMAR011562 [Perkinsus marinus ATCC 50983]|uniref:Uncharacterized protein n=1 Tax=Perkinsus marinus (strain ATCC 50983 / TXsc) TaxID=423536 RepID=C5LC51_PERM5|nr:hypothetical protein Pmar_PMAR011562 [Perkinsus marinus ATCC 50983]EER05534.1 hypothetical protein Pmar_PMAR011562 [Perkinsus marinus ATCC 50983]|eukprot:XP_002773718.1 hypothetical protein Pmar_PMAR011562 [Perkinsus marinus ATCC 50983]
MQTSKFSLSAPPAARLPAKKSTILRSLDSLKVFYKDPPSAEDSCAKDQQEKPGVDLRLLHYQAMQDAIDARKRLVLGSGLYRLSRRRAAIPGYGGFIPLKDSANVLGCSYRRANLIASEMMERLNPHVPPAELLG